MIDPDNTSGCQACALMIENPAMYASPYDYGWHDCGTPLGWLFRMLRMLITHQRWVWKIAKKDLKRRKKYYGTQQKLNLQ